MLRACALASLNHLNELDLRHTPRSPRLHLPDGLQKLSSEGLARRNRLPWSMAGHFRFPFALP